MSPRDTVNAVMEVLRAFDITPKDLKSAVELLADTRQENLRPIPPPGTPWTSKHQLPTAKDVQALTARIGALEQKMDALLAALKPRE